MCLNFCLLDLSAAQRHINISLCDCGCVNIVPFFLPCFHSFEAFFLGLLLDILIILFQGNCIINSFTVPLPFHFCHFLSLRTLVHIFYIIFHMLSSISRGLKWRVFRFCLSRIWRLQIPFNLWNWMRSLRESMKLMTVEGWFTGNLSIYRLETHLSMASFYSRISAYSLLFRGLMNSQPCKKEIKQRW